MLVYVADDGARPRVRFIGRSDHGMARSSKRPISAGHHAVTCSMTKARRTVERRCPNKQQRKAIQGGLMCRRLISPRVVRWARRAPTVEALAQMSRKITPATDTPTSRLGRIMRGVLGGIEMVAVEAAAYQALR